MRDGQRGRLEWSENDPVSMAVWKDCEGAGITVSTAGLSGVRMDRHKGQHGQLEGSVEGPA